MKPADVTSITHSYCFGPISPKKAELTKMPRNMTSTAAAVLTTMVHAVRNPPVSIVRRRYSVPVRYPRQCPPCHVQYLGHLGSEYQPRGEDWQRERCPDQAGIFGTDARH